MRFLSGTTYYCAYNASENRIKDYSYESMLNYIKRFKQIKNSRAPLDTVTVKIHIIRKSDGAGQLVTLNEISTELDSVNDVFNNAFIYFEICPQINYIDNDNLYDFENGGTIQLHIINSLGQEFYKQNFHH